MSLRSAHLLVLVALSLSLSACQHRAAAPTPTGTATPAPSPSATHQQPTATRAPSASPAPSRTPSATAPASGPGYSPGLNPLTGQYDPGTAGLRRSPVLVAITNFPPSSRPQAGLSQAAHVWETSIGQGLTRFLAVYYGDYQARLAALAPAADLPYDFAVGPVRSGRVGFETIRTFYPEALLITRAASAEVLPELKRHISLNALDPQDVNSAGLRVEDFHELPYEQVAPATYGRYRFDPAPPRGGQLGPDLRLIYNRFAHVGWRYEPTSGAYLRLQDGADGEGLLSPQFDRLTGEPLRFENVVVLFARHSFENVAGTILTLELSFVPDRFGLLFRDGRWQEIRWSSRKAELKLLDEEGELVPLKPGRTFFEVVSLRSTWDPESRLVRYHSPPLPTLTSTPITPTLTPTETATSPATDTEEPAPPGPTDTPAPPTDTPEPSSATPEPPTDTPEP